MSENTKNNDLILGIDVGTSGIRGVVVNTQNDICKQATMEMPFPNRKDDTSEQNPTVWTTHLNLLFKKLGSHLPQVSKIIIDATSSTVCLADSKSKAASIALMYDDRRAVNEAKLIHEKLPGSSGAHGASSTLAKVLWLQSQSNQTLATKSLHICHQIDFLNGYLCGVQNITDENNALKLGYDSVTQSWPNAVKQLVKMPLPQVVKPGALLGKIRLGLVDLYNFNPQCQIYAGTTDSIAAFLASGASHIGDAVTSLGSTLAIKLLTDKPIFAPKYGIYSHYVKGQWLVGGASNTGGAVLLQYFTLAQLLQLLPHLSLEKSTEFNYYPLLSKGERFPIADPELAPRVSPRPESDSEFLKALLEGLTQIEALGYQRLTELGCAKVVRIYTAGGGINNTPWMEMREQVLPAKIVVAQHSDAAFGVTQLLSSEK